MKKNLLEKVMYILAVVLQVITIVGVFIVQYLTNKKAGVLRHVYYRKYQFENGIFSVDNINIYKIVVIAFILLFIFMLIYVIKKNKSKFNKIQVSIGLLLSILLYIVMTSGYFVSKVAYHYFIMAFALVLLIQIIVIATTNILKK